MTQPQRHFRSLGAKGMFVTVPPNVHIANPETGESLNAIAMRLEGLDDQLVSRKFTLEIDCHDSNLNRLTRRVTAVLPGLGNVVGQAIHEAVSYEREMSGMKIKVEGDKIDGYFRAELKRALDYLSTYSSQGGMTLATIFKERDNLFLCQIVRTYQWTEESAGPVDPPKPLITMGMLFDMPPLGESLMRWIADGKKCFSFHT